MMITHFDTSIEKQSYYIISIRPELNRLMALIFFLAPFLLSLLAGGGDVVHAQLSSTFYTTSCPSLPSIVQSAMAKAISTDPRMGASILRLHFHDCFVQGCDGSVLLDDTATFTGEKNAAPNMNSLRGFEVIDTIKAEVEAACRATVSCADIVALAARDGVVSLGGPSWTVLFGRRDSTTASLAGANTDLPGPFSSLSSLISAFAAKGLTADEMTALSGAHTIGSAKCSSFRTHIYNDRDINATFAAQLQKTCPQSGGDGNLAPLDFQTPIKFDNQYFKNLVEEKALLHSDQELFIPGGSQRGLARRYSKKSAIFAGDFGAAMVKMGNISVLTGSQGQIRLNCRRVN